MTSKLVFHLDAQCDLCARGLAKLQKLQPRNTDVYGSRNLKTGKAVGRLQLVPDYNGSGILTHWHVR